MSIFDTLCKILSDAQVTSAAFKFSSSAKQVFNTTSSLEASAKAMSYLVDGCAPPQIKYPLKCLILFSQLGVVVTSGGNPVSIALAFGALRQIIGGE